LSKEEGPEHIFGWIGLQDKGDHFVSAAGLYDYFWALESEKRTKILEGWITAIEAFLEPEFNDNSLGKTKGVLYVSACEARVEEKPSGNVIPFPAR